MFDLRVQLQEIKKIGRDLLLSKGERKLLDKLFWHKKTKDIQEEVASEVLVNIFLREDRFADPKMAEQKAGELVIKYVQAGLLERRWKGCQPLGEPLMLTIEGQKFVRESNVQHRPVIDFLRELFEKKVSIILALIGLFAGILSIYAFFFKDG